MPAYSITRSCPSFKNVLAISIAIRVALVLYSEWHDAHSVVKYTDVDYRVFTDAAQFILRPTGTNKALGPVRHPYSRETYRYTPLLALLLTPNAWLHPSFGKYLFAACDIINGMIIHQLLATELSHDNQVLATLYSAIHLLNPLVFSISTRGSSESVLSLFVLLTLYAALKGRWDAAAVMLGVSTHWKIYPVVYGVACLGVIGSESGKKGLGALVNRKSMRFAFLSAGTFCLLGLGCYLVWGYAFLYESYLYHLHRLDHRHNFSPYFYLTYLTYPIPSKIPATIQIPLWSRLLRSPLTSFVPQMTLAIGTGLLFGREKKHLAFTWFVQTVVFVLFNKVCTSQYFLWYLLLLPLILPQLSISRGYVASYIIVWVGVQALWLSEAYKLEFLGEQVFLGLWARSLVYVIGNCWVLQGVMTGYNP
ncbi:glycosyltransferase family 50 protein [Infundibulicybe gibba]|nr:glycosyltransferase family 50 protein [Infundibulicybe gibba]